MLEGAGSGESIQVAGQASLTKLYFPEADCAKSGVLESNNAAAKAERSRGVMASGANWSHAVYFV